MMGTRLLMSLGILLIAISETKSEYCEQKEVKSSTGVYRPRQFDYRAHKWIGGVVEYATLYKYLLCKNAKMETGKPIFSANVQNDYKYVIFENSTILVVPAGVFTSLTNTIEVYLNSSKLKMIEPGAFNGMMKLEELHLENNKLEEIARGTLNSLTHLKRLDISRNNLSKIEDNSFHGLLILEELKLSHNNLTNITLFTFSSLGNLSHLDLSYNSLSAIDDNSFMNMNKLTQLIISNNFLRYIPSVQNLAKLQFLKLCFNNIKEIDFNLVPGIQQLNISYNDIQLVKNWHKMENTIIMDMSYNKISEIGKIGNGIINFSIKQNNLRILDEMLFNNSTDLYKLVLSYNFISEVNANAFKGLLKLTYLYLDNNNLEFLPIGTFKDLVSLQYLNLSHNLLMNLEFGTFAGVSRLNTLYLDHNNFVTIHENSFHVFDQLEILTLNNNNIRIIDTDDFLKHLKHLRNISLNNNNWTCNSLLNIINTFKDRKVNVSKGNSFDVPNIDGIPCTNEINVQTENKSSTLHLQTTPKENKLEIFLENEFYNTSFYKYLDQDFKNSSFYNFFEKDLFKYMEDNFVKTRFYKFFDRDFVNAGFFNYFAQNFKNKELPSDAAVTNSNHLSNENAYSLRLEQAMESNKNFELFANKIIILISVMIILLIFVVIMFMSLFCYLRFNRHSKLNVHKFSTEANMELI